MNSLEFATRAHEGQTRKDGVAYITHPTAVADIAFDIGQKLKLDGPRLKLVMKVAHLHDVVEDTQYTLLDIEEAFDYSVAVNVKHLTHDKEGGQSDDEYIYNLIAKAPKIAKIVKLADITHNLSTAGNLFGRYKMALWRLSKKLLERELGL